MRCENCNKAIEYHDTEKFVICLAQLSKAYKQAKKELKTRRVWDQ